MGATIGAGARSVDMISTVVDGPRVRLVGMPGARPTDSLHPERVSKPQGPPIHFLWARTASLVVSSGALNDG